MIAKLFEIRDRATFVPVLAVQLAPTCEADRYLLGRAGYGLNPEDQATYIQVSRINGGTGQSTCDPYDWTGGARTLPVAHDYIIEHWEELKSGDVVDVEYILGETETPKESERITTLIPR